MESKQLFLKAYSLIFRWLTCNLHNEGAVSSVSFCVWSWIHYIIETNAQLSRRSNRRVGNDDVTRIIIGNWFIPSHQSTGWAFRSIDLHVLGTSVTERRRSCVWKCKKKKKKKTTKLEHTQTHTHTYIYIYILVVKFGYNVHCHRLIWNIEHGDMKI